MNCIVVCHAGVGIGVGHLTRSLVVANAIQKHFNCEISFLIQGNRIERDDLKRYKTTFISFDDDLAEYVAAYVEATVKQIFIFDIHADKISKSLLDTLAKIRQPEHILIGIDALIKFNNLLDMVFMPTFKEQPDPTPGSNTIIIKGWDCFLLNTRFKPVQWKFGKKVLILTGGSDATNLGKTLPSLLNVSFDRELEIHWVIGPYSGEPVLPASSIHQWVLHRAPQSLDALMLETNFAITVYGVSFFELIYYGVPTVVFSPYGNKDDEELMTISNEQVALVANDENDAVKKFNQLLTNHSLASSISDKAKLNMSVPGGNKFVEMVEKLIAKKW